MSLPILYTFRRCPYAIRARLALAWAKIEYQPIEVALKDKPAALLALNPKGTVPVLQGPKNMVISESRDIMLWAFENTNLDLSHLISPSEYCSMLIDENDTTFKLWLDRYKYADRHPDISINTSKTKITEFLTTLEHRLQEQAWLAGAQPGQSDMAIFPFVRQCAAVDLQWFKSLPMPALQTWWHHWLEHPLFIEIMKKK